MDKSSFKRYVAVGLAALTIGLTPAAAQQWKPSKPVELVVG